MTVLLCLVGVFSYLEYNTSMLVMILLFLITFQQSDGPVFYIYASEIAVDTGLGFSFLALKGSALALSLTTEYLMDSKLQPPGVFWLFSTCTLASALFFICTMRETRGLTDKQKKRLYRPETIVWEEGQDADNLT